MTPEQRALGLLQTIADILVEKGVPDLPPRLFMAYRQMVVETLARPGEYATEAISTRPATEAEKAAARVADAALTCAREDGDIDDETFHCLARLVVLLGCRFEEWADAGGR